jgi:hypothetical protein
MKRTAILLFVVAIAAFGISHSAVNFGWPPIGFEAATLFWGFGVAVGVAALLSAVLFFILHKRRKHRGA